MKALKFYGCLFSIFAVFLLIACSGSGGSGDIGGIGTLSLSMTDAATDEYQAVFVTIIEVQVHLGGNDNSPNHWKSLQMPISPLTVNLLDLVNGVREDLGLVDLNAGRYTQMRLIIGDTPGPDVHPFANYLITNTVPAEIHEMKIPSGFQTGVKIVHGFIINADQTTELLLDFDASRSIVQAGNSGQWLLKPTVKVLETDEYAIIKGRVTDDAAEPLGINGALVTIQKYDGDAYDPKDKVIVLASTLTDSMETDTGDVSDGHYTVFVEPLNPDEHYNMVVYKDGKVPDFVRIEQLGIGETVSYDFMLGDAQTGTVSGTVTINGGDDVEQYATLSFRQDAVPDEMIEVKSINVLNTQTYNVDLPEGSYALVASTLFGFDTKEEPLTVPTTGDTNINFP
jgi:hypothetical protein